MIEFKDMTFQYNKKQTVFRNFNASLPTDNIHGLLGHNGAGKTTLFRLIMGVIKPALGVVLVNNMILQNYKPYISYMPETNGIYEKLTVAQNIEFRGRAAKLGKSKINVRTNELLDVFQLEKRKNELTGTLSNGLKKRLGLACAMISNPKLLLLDEPTNGIDPESLLALIEVLKKIKKTDTAIVVSSHNLEFIDELVDSITIIKNGALVFNSDINNVAEPVKTLYFNKLQKFREVNDAARGIIGNS